MPAPSLSFVNSIRSGLLARHYLLRLEHSSGTVFAWDGIGELLFQGNVYKGVGGLGRVDGLTESRDLQNHEVTVTLSGVTLQALAVTDQSIRGRAAIITAVWLNESGTIVAHRVMFVGLGEYMQPVVSEREWSLRIALRSPIANWEDIPARYYTGQDQKRLFAGDTGFDLVKGLQNATVTGWSPTAELTGGYLKGYLHGGGTGIYNLRDTLTGRLVGSGAHGAFAYGSGSWRNFADDGTTLRSVGEAETGSLSAKDATDYLTIGGFRVAIDVNGYAQTAGGKRLQTLVSGTLQGSTTDFRLMTEITALTGATGTFITVYTLSGTQLLKRSSTAGTAFIMPGSIIDNRGGYRVIRNAGTSRVEYTNDSGGVEAYVDEVSGSFATVAAPDGSRLRVDGADCVMDTSGAVRSNAGNRLVLASNPTNNFLRVWT